MHAVKQGSEEGNIKAEGEMDAVGNSTRTDGGESRGVGATLQQLSAVSDVIGSNTRNNSSSEVTVVKMEGGVVGSGQGRGRSTAARSGQQLLSVALYISAFFFFFLSSSSIYSSISTSTRVVVGVGVVV